MNVAVEFRALAQHEIDSLLPLMRDFYSFEKIAWDEARTRRLLAQLISDPKLGRIIIFERDDQLLGYLLLTFGFSLEFHGRDALIDEFYVLPEHRSSGIGKRALDYAIDIARQQGVSAFHLEADHFNQRAHDFYLRLGFKDHQRHLMTKWLKQTSG